MNDDIECNWFTASADSVVYEYIRVFHWFGEAGAYCAQVLTGEVNEWKYWFFYTDYAMVIGLKHRTLQNDDHLYNILWKLCPNVLAFFHKIWTFCTHFFSLIFGYFLMFFIIFAIFGKRKSVEHAEFAIHLRCWKPCFLQLLAHIYTKNYDIFYENYDILSWFFRQFSYRLGTFIIVELLEQFSLKRIVFFEEICKIFLKNTKQNVTFCEFFLDIFPLFCVKNTENMDFMKFEKGGSYGIAFIESS